MPDTGKEIFSMSLLKTVSFLTNQAAQFCYRGIADFIFSHKFPMAIPWMDLLNIFGKTIGSEYNSISLHFVRLQQYFFLFQSLDVRASHGFQSDLL